MPKRCPGYTSDGSAGTTYSQGPHMLEAGDTNFSPGKNQCRDCYRAYAQDWRAKRGVGTGTGARRRLSPTVAVANLNVVGADGQPVVPDVVVGDHAYRPMADLVSMWGAVTQSVKHGSKPSNIIFLGPSGCGKTEGAEYLASLAGLPFTKVDAAAMTDPESWFGTREVVEKNGVSVTDYRPSSFVLSIEEPGVTFIDEMNRSRDEHRNILLALLDGTRQVTNPLTGDIVRRHDKNFVIMAGNRGLQFTGTYAVDPALMTRALVVNFDYAQPDEEKEIAKEATGCSQETADLFVRFADESRKKAKLDADFSPISTREVILASRMVACGLTADAAARFVVINAASPEGGAASVAASLENIWAAVRTGAASVALVPCTESRWGETCKKMAPHEGEQHESDESGYEW